MNAPKRSEKQKGIGLALAALLGGAGCATTQVRSVAPPLKPNQIVQIAFDVKGCPADVVPIDLDQTTTCDKSRCFKAAKGQQVTFQASPAKSGDLANDYELQFDPFKSAPLKSSGGQLTLTIDVDMPQGASKTFPYNVLSVPRSKCDPLDPQIIIVN